MAPERTLYALSGFLGGVFIAGLHRPGLSVIAMIFISAWLFMRHGPLALALAALASGLIYYHGFFTVRAYRGELPNAAEAFMAVVVDEPAPGARSERLLVRLLPPARGKLEVIVSPEIRYAYGDLLRLRGKPEAGENERERAIMAFPEVELVGRNAGNPVRARLIELKHALLGPFARSLPEREAAFLGGITLGAREALPDDLRDAMKKSGTTHLVALSGYNIQLVIVAVFGAAAFAFGRRRAYATTVPAIIGFVVMVGFEASIVRAAVMALLFLTAAEIGRLKSMPHAMLFAAAFMALANPGVLFSVGFQLSFASLLGILYIAPSLARFQSSSARLRLIGETTSLTLGAQAAVAPILLVRFGEVSLVALPANLLILPLIPATMALGFALAFAGAFAPALGYALTVPLHALLKYELAMISWWGSIAS